MNYDVGLRKRSDGAAGWSADLCFGSLGREQLKVTIARLELGLGFEFEPAGGCRHGRYGRRWRPAAVDAKPSAAYRVTERPRAPARNATRLTSATARGAGPRLTLMG